MYTSFQPSHPLSLESNKSISSRVAKCKRPRIRSNYEEPEIDAQFSRRVFNIGVLVSAIGTSWVGYRIVFGDDLKSQIAKRLRGQFPALFPKQRTSEDRRGAIDAQFCTIYYTSLANVASEMRILSPKDLYDLEQEVQQRASSLFFKQAPQFTRVITDPTWLNFLLYSRLHVIAERTSSRMRREFAERVAARTLRELPVEPLRRDATWARGHSDAWIDSIRSLLDCLESIGWISGYSISDFEGGDGSAWREEGRSALTVYAYDPLPIQAAQLMGEEEYEEISPKISPWIKAFLRSAGISNISMEDYYLDDQYRPDPTDFKPSQLATEFDLSLS